MNPKPAAPTPTLYDVGIIGMNNKIEAIIGTNLTEDKAEKRIETGLSRINENYFVDRFPAGKYKIGDFKAEAQ